MNVSDSELERRITFAGRAHSSRVDSGFGFSLLPDFFAIPDADDLGFDSGLGLDPIGALPLPDSSFSRLVFFTADKSVDHGAEDCANDRRHPEQPKL